MGDTAFKTFKNIEMLGERVRLRPLRPEDAVLAYALVRDGQVTRILGWDGPADEQEMQHTYASVGLPSQGQGQSTTYSFAIERLEDAMFMGSIAVRLRPSPQQVDVRYWVGVPFWNGGYMTDALRMTVHFAFEHLEAVRVSATVYVGNGGSKRVLEKNGFHFDGQMRCAYQKLGEWQDAWFFTLLRREWEEQRERYRPRIELLAPA
ncbi:MAG: N-acetyltransferase [Dehalococcoidia bacterium]|nr:N-acetyltransferase [Dehalococcoidia bacterium]